MIDRAERNAVVEVLEDFRKERLTMSEFRERMGNLAEDTEDETLRYCVDEVYFFYEACEDEEAGESNIDRVVAEKAVWEVWERMRLLLLRDLEFKVQRPGYKRYPLAPACSLVGLALLVWRMWLSGGMLYALGAYLLLGVVAVCVLHWRRAVADRKYAPEGKAAFTSLEQMSRAIRAVPGYCTKRKPVGQELWLVWKGRIGMELGLIVLIPIFLCLMTKKSEEMWGFWHGA